MSSIPFIPILVTVIYATHGSDVEEPFPYQTVHPSAIEVIPVREEDPFRPRMASIAAIPQAQGKYVILLDDGDTFREDFLELLIDALEHTDALFAVSSQGFKLTNRRSGKLYWRPSEDMEFTPADRYAFIPTELAGILFRTETIQPLIQQALSSPEPEKLLLIQLLKGDSTFLYFWSFRLKRAFPGEIDFLYDLRRNDRDWYFVPFQEFLLPLLREAKDDVPPELQNMALFMVLCRLFSNQSNQNRHIIARDEVDSYVELLAEVLQYVDETTILNCPLFLTGKNLAIKLFLLRTKKHDFSWYPTVGVEEDTLALKSGEQTFAVLKNLQVQLFLIDYKDGRLEIDGNLFGVYPRDQIRVFACLNEERYPVVYNGRFSFSKFFGVTFSKQFTFHVSVPIHDFGEIGTLRFLFCTDFGEYDAVLAFPFYTSRFSKEFSAAYWRFGPYFAQHRRNTIQITRANKLRTLKSELRLWAQMYKRKKGKFRKQLPLKITNFLLRPWFAHRKIWLFFDKIYKGGDSSEYIYRYASAKDDGIKKYYLLDKNTPDYKRLRAEGYRPLVRGTLKHRLVFLNADLVVASNSTVFPFNDYNFSRSFPIRGDVHFSVACVQHGMSIQKIALAQQRLRDNTKLYFCASKYEIENLSKPVYDYRDYDILKLTGVPRYDGLHDRKQKILLFSPTWRMNSALPVSKNEGVARDYNPDFKETSYFQVYNSLLNDPRLLNAARQYGYRIQYILHPIVSPQYEDFTQNDLVEIIPATGEMSYEKLFCEAALMVSDFSGVQFDFAYMRKPVVYLHHNNIPQHYENGTFFYDTMGFGEICHTNDELIDTLCEYMKHDCEMPEMYRKRADDFFAFSDDHNCERIYPHLLEYEKNLQR